MARPWKTLDTAECGDGSLLELRQRGDDDFLILDSGRVLMNSYSRSSEEALSTLALAQVKPRPDPRVLVAGLGMGFTLRAALDQLPPKAIVTVCELNPIVVEWCKGPLGPATDHAIADPRVEVLVQDVAEVIRAHARGRFDAILLDLYEGPNDASQGIKNPFYSPRAIEEQRAALLPGGVLGVWGEDKEPRYEKRLTAGKFDITTHAIGTGGRKHIVFIGKRRDA